MSNPIVSFDEEAVKSELRELVRKAIEETIIEMYLAGVSTRRIEDVSEILWGAGVSAGTVPNLNGKAFRLGTNGDAVLWPANTRTSTSTAST